VPDDVSVVGFDDVPEAGYFLPPLTTVRQDFAELGRRSLDLLVGQLSDDVPASGDVLLAPELVVRGSTAPPPSR
jgi:DNA-binding LacI/PurR family transcriptional regulator